MRLIAAFMMLMPLLNPCFAQQKFAPVEADYVAHNFHFKSGRDSSRTAAALHDDRQAGARRRRQSHKCGVDPARDRRFRASISGAAIC